MLSYFRYIFALLNSEMMLKENKQKKKNKNKNKNKNKW